jgi:hypothetical protein
VEEVAVDVGDLAAEEVADVGVGVLADRDQEVGPQARVVDAGGDLVGDPLSLLGLVGVEEVLLELVEDQQRGGVEPLAHRAQRGFEVLAAELGHSPIGPVGLGGSGDRVDQAADRVAAPGAEDHRQQPRRAARRAFALAVVAEAGDDSRPQHRALADAALGVEQGQPRRPQVADDHGRLGFAAEEPLGVRFGEVGEADVGVVDRRRGRRRGRLGQGPTLAPPAARSRLSPSSLT